jgi:hypothetical protein
MGIELYPKFLSLAETRRYQPLYESIVVKCCQGPGASVARQTGNVPQRGSRPMRSEQFKPPASIASAKKAVAGPKRTGHELRPPPENTPGRVTSSFLAS